MREIRTARLRLVPVTVKNAGVLWEVLQEPDLRDFQDLPNLNRDAVRQSSSTRGRSALPQARRVASNGCCTSSDGLEPLGWVSLRLSDGDKSSAEIGYSVVRAYRNRGIATEAVAALIGEGFHRARLQRIRAYCLPENHFSRAVLKRAGFETDGTLPRGATVQGRPVDVLTHILTCADWERTCHPERSRRAQ